MHQNGPKRANMGLKRTKSSQKGTILLVLRSLTKGLSKGFTLETHDLFKMLKSTRQGLILWMCPNIKGFSLFYKGKAANDSGFK